MRKMCLSENWPVCKDGRKSDLLREVLLVAHSLGPQVAGKASSLHPSVRSKDCHSESLNCGALVGKAVSLLNLPIQP